MGSGKIRTRLIPRDKHFNYNAAVRVYLSTRCTITISTLLLNTSTFDDANAIIGLPAERAVRTVEFHITKYNIRMTYRAF